MPGFDLKHALGAEAAVPHLGQLVVRVGLAACLGAIVAFRPWRRLIAGSRPPSAQAAQSQTLIAASGALMVIVIGESIARAFGLVGLGSFIRFRSGIRDPRDAALLFVMIGIGMACGLGLPVMAASGAAFVTLLLMVFDLSARQRVTVTIDTTDPAATLDALARLFPGARTVELKRAPNDGEPGRVVVELDLGPKTDAPRLSALLEKDGAVSVTRVQLDD
ncbi:MAG TPA: DUF4956 domain-containing protein [Polyangiaceae bacterium]|jgi:uncharacterized membrane protein YhiD involved in acid resistance|nr:DUF4956 domain-containing protein [Polyangiaceae bacterium]